MKAHFGNYDAAQGRTNAVYFNVNINKVGKCRGIDNLKTKLWIWTFGKFKEQFGEEYL